MNWQSRLGFVWLLAVFAAGATGAYNVAKADDLLWSLAEIQERLTSLGYDAGPNDGVMGESTAKAIRNFQRVVGLAVTGEHDSPLEDHLFRECGVSFSFGTGSPAAKPYGGCRKPVHEMDGLYTLCLRDSGDCSEPRENGVTDSVILRFSEPLE